MQPFAEGRFLHSWTAPFGVLLTLPGCDDVTLVKATEYSFAGGQGPCRLPASAEAARLPVVSLVM